MSGRVYEKHVHPDPDFPFFFHRDTTQHTRLDRASYHWHESIEILNCISGSFTAVVDGNRLVLNAGKTVIIDPLSLHATLTNGQDNSYYCLIVDKSFCAAHSLTLPDGAGAGVFSDARVNALFGEIDGEVRERDDGWKTAVSAAVLALCVRLNRMFPGSDSLPALEPRSRSALAQNMTRYLYEHIDSRFSMNQLCSYMGFSKYYLCHIFRDATGESIVGYLNKLRCDRAQKLISSGCHKVGEAAEKSGFMSFSYFTRVYKKIYGHCPSEDLPVLSAES